MKSRVIIKPVITEKSELLSEEQEKYTFVVARGATKGQIKAAIEDLYEVKVSNVNTAILPGKTVIRGTKTGWVKGKKPAFKKAYISLSEGEIDFYGEL